ncbi:MAG: TRAP transporter substrate-binding protein DctP [Deltaproteobacteria bacterium]|nr:TRAP transporter substrate-binding protein DctP [Deltaproteobacteria bacterium]
MTKLVKVACLLAMVAALAVAGLPEAVQAKTYTLRIQCIYPETSYVPQMIKQFVAKAEKYTKGQVEIKLFWPGQLVSAKKGYDAVSKGMVEGLVSALIYYGGTLKEGKVEWLPFTWRDPKEAYDLYVNGGFLELMRKANQKQNVQYLFPVMAGTMGCMTNFPVNSLADFKGQKMRAPGLDGPIVKLLGASPVSLSAKEIYMSLQRGTVDGVVYPYYTLSTYKLYEVIKYAILPGFHTPAMTGLYLNLDFWKSLPPELQAALNKAGLETFHASSLKSPQWDQAALKAAEGKGVKVLQLSQADVLKLRKMCMPLWDKVGSATPLSKQLVELLKSYLQKKGAL